MAYDYEKAKVAYESLSPEQRKAYVDSHKDDANMQRFASEYAREKSGVTASTSTTPVSSPYQNQGAGNYTYNEKTWYYENQTDTSRNTTNQGLAPRPENVKTETPTKQGETVVNTVPEIQQQGQLKPLSQDYYNQTSDEAQNKIRANLNWYRQTNPELFSTYEDFKKNFSYDSRDEVQKQTLDNWYTGYQKSMELSAIPTNELYTQYKDWTVSLSDLETLRISNPEKYAELQETINKWNIISAYDDDKGADTWMNIQDMAYQFLAQSFNKLMNGDSSNGASQIFKEYQDKMDNPEMLDLSDKCTEVQEQMENIQTDIDSMRKSVEAEYEWTWASKAKINAIVADRTYDLQLQLRTLNSEYNKYATQYNNRMQQYQNEFNMQLQEYQINQNERQVQMKELGFALDLMNFETNDQKQEREWNYWVRQQEYQNWNINSKDYQTRYKAALKSVQNLLSQYEWIPMERSAEQMTQDVLKAIDNGSDLGTELTKINKLIQGKPEYKMLYNATFGTSSQGFGKTVNIWGTDYVEYNWKLYTSDEFNKQFWKGTKANYTVVGEDKLKTYSDGRAWTYGSFMSNPKNNDKNYIWECAKFVNNYLQEIWAWRLFGNEDIATRKWWINSDEWKVGTIAVFDYNHKSSDGINHGHVGIVVSAPDKNGDFWVKDANFDSDGIIQTRKVNLKDVSLQWFIDPTLDQNGNRWSVGTSSTWTTTTTSTMTVWNLTPAQFDSYVKQFIDWNVNYSEVKATYGDDWLAKVRERAEQLKEWGYEISTKITDPTKQANMEEKLRKEYDKAVSDAQETIDWVNKMQEAYNLIDTNKNAASQAIVIAYNKILDPGSVVREWEYARSAEWQSKLKQIQAKLEQFASWWAWLTKDELKSLVDVASTFSTKAKQVQKNAADRTMVSINKYWLTPEAILPLSALNQINNSTTTSSSSWTQEQNFYQKYANTAPWTWKKRPFGTNSSSTIVLSDWQSFKW